jgi:tetratricopeptide (TPR) repeat protein
MDKTATHDGGALMAREHFERCHALAVAGDHDRALTGYDELDRAHGASTDPEVRAVVAAGLLEKAELLDKAERRDDELEVYSEIIGRYGRDRASSVRHQVARARFNNAATVVASGRIDQAHVLLDDLVGEYSGDDSVEVLDITARALCQIGFLHAHSERVDDALAAFDSVGERFGGVAQPALRKWAVTASSAGCQLLTASGEVAEAERRYRELTSRYRNDESASVRGEAAAALLTRALVIADGRSSVEAHRAFMHVVSQHGDDGAPEAARVVCLALWRDAELHMALDDMGGALPVLRKIRQDYAGAADPAVLDIRATASLYLGLVLAELGRKEEAIETYRCCQDELWASERPEAKVLHAYATYREAGALISLDRQEDAIVLLAEMLDTVDGDALELVRAAEQSLGLLVAERFGAEIGSEVFDRIIAAADADERFDRYALAARWFKARLLEDSRPLEAAEVYDEIITQDFTLEADALLDVMRSKVAVFAARADAFRAGGDTAAELRAYDALIEAFADSPDPGAQGEVAIAKANKALTLLNLSQHAESIGLCDDVVGRHHAGLAGESLTPVAHAMFTKASALQELGRTEAALSAFDAPASLRAGDDPEVARWSARAALARAELLAELDRCEEAAAEWAGVAHRYGDRFEPEFRRYCAEALCLQGDARARLGDADAAIALWTHVVVTYRRDPEAQLHELVARALHAVAQAHEVAKRPGAAASVYGDLVDSYSDHPSERIVDLVESAKTHLRDA